jgi:hypothetical protein
VLWLTNGGSKQRCCYSSGGEKEISSSSPLLWFFHFFFLCFVYPWLSFCPLGFVLKKKTSLPGFKLPLTLSFFSLFHFSLWLVPPPPFLLLLPTVLLSTRKTVVAGGGGEDVLCSWWWAVLSVGQRLAAAFFACVEVQVPFFFDGGATCGWKMMS